MSDLLSSYTLAVTKGTSQSLIRSWHSPAWIHSQLHRYELVLSAFLPKLRHYNGSVARLSVYMEITVS